MFKDEYVDLYIAVRCNLVKKSDFKNIWSNLEKSHIWDNYSPNENGTYDGFIGEYPWGISFANMFNKYPSVRTSSGVNDELYKTYHELLVEYEFDVSLGDETSYSRYVPSEIFFNKSELKWNKKAGFIDKTNNLCFQDPHVFNGGPSMLLGNKKYLEEFCSQNELYMVWTIHSKKTIVKKDPETYLCSNLYALYGFNGEYIMTDYKIVKEK